MADPQRILLIVCLLQGLLCQDWKAELPQSIEAISGSCVTIPCSFSIPTSYEKHLNTNCFGALIRKDADDARLYSSIPDAGSKTGILTTKNCTTILNDTPSTGSGRYIFRIHCPNELKYSFLMSDVNIMFKALPPNPRLHPATVDVMEGTSVSLKCSAEVFCPTLPPSLIWTPSLSGVLEIEHQTNFTALTFTASHLHHGQPVSCIARYPRQNGGNLSSQTSLIVNVSYAPKKTSVLVNPLGPVLERSTVTLTCNSDANPAVNNYTWYRVDGKSTITVSHGHNLSFTEISFNNRGEYYCVAQNKHGQDKSLTTKIYVASAPKLLSSSHCTVYGDYINCSCESSGRPSPTLEWQLGGVPVNHSNDTLVRHEPLTNRGSRSFLFMRTTEGNTPTLACLSSNSVGSASLQYRVDGTKASGGQVSLTMFATVVVLLCVGLLLFAILFLLRVCVANRSPTDSKSYIAKKMPSIEEPIYENTVMREGLQRN